LPYWYQQSQSIGVTDMFPLVAQAGMTTQLDMFSDEVSSALPKVGRQAQLKRSTSAMSEDGMVDYLENTGRYRVLRKLEPRAVATAPNSP
jgi:hypothetical protein